MSAPRYNQLITLPTNRAPGVRRCSSRGSGPSPPFRHGRQPRVAEREKMPQAPGAPPYPAGPHATPGDPRAPGPLSPPSPPDPPAPPPVPWASGQTPAPLTPGLTRLRQLLLGFQPQLLQQALSTPRARQLLLAEWPWLGDQPPLEPRGRGGGASGGGEAEATRRGNGRAPGEPPGKGPGRWRHRFLRSLSSWCSGKRKDLHSSLLPYSPRSSQIHSALMPILRNSFSGTSAGGWSLPAGAGLGTLACRIALANT